MKTSLETAVTHTEKKYDGFGENYKTVILTMAFAEFNNIPFVYSPFKELCHADNADFVAKMEEVVNLKKYLELNDQYAKQKYDVHNIRKMDLLYFFDNNIAFFEKSNTLQLIKTAFNEKNANPWKTMSLSSNTTTTTNNIAIHIRRPDVYDLHLFGGAPNIDRLNVPSSLYVTIIKQFLGSYPNSKIHIYSQSSTDGQNEFDIYKSIDKNRIVLHIDEPLDTTFVEMVYADILVMAPSTLSYTAGILSDNTIYYIPFSCPPLSQWNIVQGHVCSKSYNFLVKSVDLCIDYDSRGDSMSVTNLNGLRARID
jgi:hypothetical protein